LADNNPIPPMKPGTNPQTRSDLLLLVAFCGFLFFYGLGAFGLVGADEPRYAQVAREMLEHSDWVTPTLAGKPWLEKPALYYWQAMVAFRFAGVSEGTARIPSGVDALLLVAAAFFFLRRFRPGTEFDGALIMASCAGMIGFARAAATDMPLAACLGIALLAWYAWRESGDKNYLAVFYVFLALGTLAKGPVAPALAAVMAVLFAAIKRDWSLIRRSVWIPGIVLYLAVALPWYVLVQIRNPEFFRFFILEHNLARFSQDAYHHHQPFWFYLPVLMLAMMPWTIALLAAVVERTRTMWTEGKESFSSAEDSWPLFLLIWMLVPVVFFSASRSKLPGYILPAIPAGALLVTNWLESRREAGVRIGWWLAAAQSLACGAIIFAGLASAGLASHHHPFWSRSVILYAGIAAVLAVVIGVALMTPAGPRLFTRATIFAVVIAVAAIVRLAGPAIDDTQSARPVAEAIQAFSHEPIPVAIYKVKRQLEYGLEFYLDRPVGKYEDGNIPAGSHVLVAAQGSQAGALVPGRRVSYLTSIPMQKVDLYWVGKQ
jgi:4-amino-4-deoxy-L-arabinose transferase-like glycosyltransferase